MSREEELVEERLVGGGDGPRLESMVGSEPRLTMCRMREKAVRARENSGARLNIWPQSWALTSMATTVLVPSLATPRKSEQIRMPTSKPLGP
jgi:hypothetical protein